MNSGHPPMTIRSVPSPIQDPFELIDAASEDKPFVVAQLGQSLDGRIATPTGASRYINGTCALDHLHQLRAHVDAVVVGVGTVIADNPMLTVRRVPAATRRASLLIRVDACPKRRNVFARPARAALLFGQTSP